MRRLLIGIDSGTQSTRALVVDASSGEVVGAAAQKYGLISGLLPGAKEQHPHTWREAAAKAVKRALKSAGAHAAEVVAIGASAQQHGFVPLDKSGMPIRPAKLWCDTSTAAEGDEIVVRRHLDGVSRVAQLQEPRALDDAAALDVQAGNDSFREQGILLGGKVRNPRIIRRLSQRMQANQGRALRGGARRFRHTVNGCHSAGTRGAPQFRVSPGGGAGRMPGPPADRGT